MNEIEEKDKYQANQPTAGQWLLIAGIGLLALLGVIIFIGGGYFAASSFLAERGARATETSVIATTYVDERLDVIETASAWPVEMLETFNNNDNEWVEGKIDDEYATLNIYIDGIYSWDISSKQGFIWWVYPAVDLVNDFYLTVEARNESTNRDAAYGLIFRFSEDDNTYCYFEIRDTQLFSVWKNDNGNWTEIVPYTTSTAILPGVTNTLEIISQDDQFYFQINGELVAETTIYDPAQGYSGVAVGLSYADESSKIIFDNFELRAPNNQK